METTEAARTNINFGLMRISLFPLVLLIVVISTGFFNPIIEQGRKAPESSSGPATRADAASFQNRLSRINDPILDHRLDVRRTRNVIERVRLEDHEIGEGAIVDLADVPAGFAAE